MSTEGPSAAAADGHPIREVTGFDGTFEEAVTEGLIDKPPPIVWGDWQKYRRITQTRPTPDDDGQPYDNRVEGKLYSRVQSFYYGPNYKARARRYNTEHPNWLQALEELGTPPPAPAVLPHAGQGAASSDAPIVEHQKV